MEAHVAPERYPVPAELEPSIKQTLDSKAARMAAAGQHRPTVAGVASVLAGIFASLAPGAVIEDLTPISGGASKEHFLFSVRSVDKASQRYVLRMNTSCSLIEVDARREVEAMMALAGSIAVPQVVWSDMAGSAFGQPACIMKFCAGVTKPAIGSSGGEHTGLGTVFGQDWRVRLSQQFVDNWVAIHALDWRNAGFTAFGLPQRDDVFQVARWQVNWWSRVWREDSRAPSSIMALAERWLRLNLPACPDPVFLHGDYRTGNFLFDEDTGRITAILDWELSHIGDFHEDLAWLLQRSLGSQEGDQIYCGGLFTKADLIARYEAASDRTVDPAVLQFYELLSVFKGVCLALGTNPALVASGQSHQDVLSTWLSAYGYVGLGEMVDLLAERIA